MTFRDSLLIFLFPPEETSDCEMCWLSCCWQQQRRFHVQTLYKSAAFYQNICISKKSTSSWRLRLRLAELIDSEDVAPSTSKTCDQRELSIFRVWRIYICARHLSVMEMFLVQWEWKSAHVGGADICVQASSSWGGVHLPGSKGPSMSSTLLPRTTMRPADPSHSAAPPRSSSASMTSTTTNPSFRRWMNFGKQHQKDFLQLLHLRSFP